MSLFNRIGEIAKEAASSALDIAAEVGSVAKGAAVSAGSVVAEKAGVAVEAAKSKIHDATAPSDGVRD